MARKRKSRLEGGGPPGRTSSGRVFETICPYRGGATRNKLGNRPVCYGAPGSRDGRRSSRRARVFAHTCRYSMRVGIWAIAREGSGGLGRTAGSTSHQVFRTPILGERGKQAAIRAGGFLTQIGGGHSSLSESTPAGGEGDEFRRPESTRACGPGLACRAVSCPDGTSKTFAQGIETLRKATEGGADPNVTGRR